MRIEIVEVPWEIILKVEFISKVGTLPLSCGFIEISGSGSDPREKKIGSDPLGTKTDPDPTL